MRTFLAIATVLTANALNSKTNAMLVALLVLLLLCRRAPSLLWGLVPTVPFRRLRQPSWRHLR
jgi:hypothetical protein